MRTCIISSPLATQSGYGAHAREFIENIIEQKNNKWDIKLISMPWGATAFTHKLDDSMQKRLIPIPIQSQPDIWVQITVPNEFQKIGKYNIGVTAGTEGDLCPKEWIECINRMNLTIVPSQFTKQVFINTAKKHNITITTNIQVVSEYFDSKIYNRNKKGNLSILNDIEEEFCYLFVGHWLQGSLGEDRKNISGLIHNFIETFKNKKEIPALILKTGGATSSIVDRSNIESKINQIYELFPKNTIFPNIYLLHGELSDKEMNLLYNHKKVKALVSYTKAEGFGRPLLEFSTTDKPIIAPHYSGQIDFLKEKYIVNLPGQLTNIHHSAQSKFLIKDARWFTPDYKKASEYLIDVFENYSNYLDNAVEQRKFVTTNFSKAAVKKLYSNVLDIIDNNTSSIPQQQELKLPKLNLPKLNTIQDKKINLPKLQKV